MKKVILLSILFFGFTSIGIAQSDKLKEKASERAEKINTEIVAGDKSQALSNEQVKKITAIEMMRIKDARALRKSNAGDDEIKASNQKYFKQIYSEVLTKEQKRARMKAKNKNK